LRIGYHYHATVVFDGNDVRYPAHYAMFVEELARQAGTVVLLAPSGPGDGTETHLLDPSLIEVVDLGPRSRNITMNLWPRRWIHGYDPAELDLDALILRGPSPLLPALARRSRHLPVLILAVGDCRNWRPSRVNSAIKNTLIAAWARWYRRQQLRAAQDAHVAAISRSIVAGCGYPSTAVVFTSSISQADMDALAPHDTWEAARRRRARVRLLATGRLTEEKGLFELVEAVALLVGRSYDVEARLVGESLGDPTSELVMTRAVELGIADRVAVPGYIEAGPQLLAEYAAADIFVLPTHGEGAVNRSTKEAMASGLPVVTTSIPAVTEFIEHRRHALLVPIHDPEAIARAVAELIDDGELRSRLVDEARSWASGLTNEKSVAQVLQQLTARRRRGSPPLRHGTEP